MTNPFSIQNLVPNWTEATEILKGDLPGHEFRGNQWTSLTEKANAVLDKVMKLNGSSTPAEIRSLAQAHRDIAAQHAAVALHHQENPQPRLNIGAKRWEAFVPTPQQVHESGVEIHNAAASALENLAQMVETQPSSEATEKALEDANRISWAAALQSSTGDRTPAPNYPRSDPEFRDVEAQRVADKKAASEAVVRATNDWIARNPHARLD